MRDPANTSGPMQRMRQWWRVMVKLLPQTQGIITVVDGGNKITRDEILHYMDKVLGNAPVPGWGLRDWREYVATLFTWSTGTSVRVEQVDDLIDRSPGMPYRCNRDALAALGVEPHTWHIPITRSAQSPQGVVLAAEPHARPAKKQKTEMSELMQGMNEAQCWELVEQAAMEASKVYSGVGRGAAISCMDRVVEIAQRAKCPAPEPALLLYGRRVLASYASQETRLSDEDIESAADRMLEEMGDESALIP